MERGDAPLLCPFTAPSGPSLDLFYTPPLPSSHPSFSRSAPGPTGPILLCGTPPLPCWAGDRPLNAGPGVPDGSYRWTVVIGPIERCHRLLPAKTQKVGYITSKKKKEREGAKEEKSRRESARQRMTKATLSSAIKGASVTECFLCC